ncbi:Fcf1-domain-containing protein, partial [Coemansia spiralis]
MRPKRVKAYKRAMQFYQKNFGFREPYQVLVAADFILEAVSKNLRVVETLEETLQGKIKPFVTFCTICDIRKESEHRAQAIAVSKSFEKRRCLHKDPISGIQCIGEVMGDENKYNYCVAVQDDVLRAKLRSIPGVPIIHVKQSTMVLERISEAGKAAGAAKAQEKQGLSELERKMLKAVKQKDREAKLALRKPRAKKKIKGPKGPNPLSVKK